MRNAVQEQNEISKKPKVGKPQGTKDVPPHQKNSKYRARVESVSDDDAPKVSAPAAAKKKPSNSKLTPMSDTLID